MLDDCKTKEERYSKVQQLIQHWLAERQNLVVSYCAMSAIDELSLDREKTLRSLSNFCQVLVDYISAGHFEIYDQLIKEADEFGDQGSPAVDGIFNAISNTTDIALAFHDKYDNEEHCQASFDQLKDNLSVVGEAMVNRFALEDQLIAILHDVHALETLPG